MLNSNASHRENVSTETWVHHELSTLALGDKRRNDRVMVMTSQFAERPGASIPEVCGSDAGLKAAYRLFDNGEIKSQALLQPHIEATIKRMQQQPVVLALQDTTTLNYSNHPCTEGLGPIVSRRNSRGYFLHTTLAVSPSGVALGCLAAETFNRSAARYGSRRKSQVRNNEPIEKKESQRWINSLKACEQAAVQCPGVKMINVGDREADIYELFAHALENKLVDLLIRMQHNRNVSAEDKKLWRHLESQPIAGELGVAVPRSAGQPVRSATLSIRFCAVTICAPCLKKNKPSLRLWAVEARELHPPQGQKAIVWRLLTTLPVEDAAQAIQCVGWYARRWKIEVLHKVLKSGCHVEGRQLQTRERLDKALMLSLIVAWRVMHLMHVSREEPQAPAHLHFSELELKVLWHQSRRRSPSAPEPLTLQQAVHWMARLGGFLGRKSDGVPGPITLWRGLQRLRDLTDGFALLQNVGNV